MKLKTSGSVYLIQFYPSGPLSALSVLDVAFREKMVIWARLKFVRTRWLKFGSLLFCVIMHITVHKHVQRTYCVPTIFNRSVIKSAWRANIKWRVMSARGIGRVAGQTYLYPILPSINIVSQEHETSRCQNWAHTPQNLLKTDQVMEITMKITWKANWEVRTWFSCYWFSHN